MTNFSTRDFANVSALQLFQSNNRVSALNKFPNFEISQFQNFEICRHRTESSSGAIYFLTFPATIFFSFQKTRMSTFTLTVNNKQYTVEAEADMPLLWVLRDLLDLTGTKYGCGEASCGACTVIMDGKAIYSCSRTLGACANKKIITIEGLSEDGSHPIQKAWEKAGVTQCGYCQPGQIMAVAAMLEKNKNPSDETINSVMSNVLCRCGTYQRIRTAIHMAIEELNQ